MLSAAELSAMRETAYLALPDTAVIRRASLASDGMGGYTETWATVDTVSCRLDPPGNARLDQWQSKIMNRAAFVLNLEDGTDIKSGDQVTIGSKVYEALGLIVGSWEITRRMVVVEL